MQRIENVKGLVNILDRIPARDVFIKTAGGHADGPYYAIVDNETGQAVIPFADEAVEIYEPGEYQCRFEEV